MTKYTISIDLDYTIEASNETEALEKAEQAIKDRAYNIIIVDKEQV